MLKSAKGPALLHLNSATVRNGKMWPRRSVAMPGCDPTARAATARPNLLLNIPRSRTLNEIKGEMTIVVRDLGAVLAR